MVLQLILASKLSQLEQIEIFEIPVFFDSPCIMYNDPSGQLHQRSITSAFNYNRTYSIIKFGIESAATTLPYITQLSIPDSLLTSGVTVLA